MSSVAAEMEGTLGEPLISATPCASRPRPRQRVYFIDWMRVVAIYLVVSYHVVQALDWVGFFENEDIQGIKEFVTSFRAKALQIGMPMFFHISGRAHALSPIHGFQKTVVRRVQRLLLPFAVCYVILIPPWQYIDKAYDWDHPSFFLMKANPLAWLWRYYTSSEIFFEFDMAWLWFLPCLFVIVVMSTPLFLLAEDYRGRYRRHMRVAALLWVPLACGLVLVGFSWRFAVYSMLGPATGVVIAQFVPLPPHSPESEKASQEDQEQTAFDVYWAANLTTIAHAVGSVGMVLNFGYNDIDPARGDGRHSPLAAIPFVMLCLGFYIQGYFVQRWSKGVEHLNGESVPQWVWLTRLIAAFVVLLILMASAPVGEVETGHYIYPIYSTSYRKGAGFGAFYVLGTWCYLGIFISLFRAYVDNIVSPWLYRHATASTIIVYIFHWIFLKVCAFWMLKPTLHRWFGMAAPSTAWLALTLVVLTYVFSVGCSLGVYALVLQSSRAKSLFGI